MSSNNLLNLVATTVKINGEAVDIDTLVLKQTMTGHHSFIITANYRHDRPTVWSTTPEKIFQSLGDPVSISFVHIQNEEKTEFEGIITNIRVTGKLGDQGTVILEGGSPTLLLDMAPSMASYTDSTIDNIINIELEKVDSGMELQNAPQFSSVIPYCSRYKETSFAFLSRIAASCGEWFYYDGKKLILGNPKVETDTRAAFDMELLSVDIAASLGNMNQELYDYDPAENDFKEDAPTAQVEGVNSYMREARTKSDPFFTTPTKMPTDRFMINENDIVAQMRATYSRRYSKMSVFSAKANTCAIRLGEQVTTRLPESLQKDAGPDLGRFRVIEITHTVDKMGKYENIFKGMAGATEALPTDHVVQPTAFPEPAIVTDNQDPDQLGRVKVRFYWMPEGESTNWIRVQSTSAGQSPATGSAHGLLFIPSVDDEVMVGFQQGDPSRPFVSGSVFHGGNSTGVQPDDVISKIVSNSGHTIELNDTDGEETITIYDKEQNVIQFNTVEKSIKIQSVENIEMIAKNIKLSAEENIELGATKDINVVADGALGLQSTKDTTIKADGATTIEATKDATLKGMNLVAEGSQNADLTGGAQTNVTGKMTAVKGAAFAVEVK